MACTRWAIPSSRFTASATPTSPSTWRRAVTPLACAWTRTGARTSPWSTASTTCGPIGETSSEWMRSSQTGLTSSGKTGSSCRLTRASRGPRWRCAGLTVSCWGATPPSCPRCHQPGRRSPGSVPWSAGPCSRGAPRFWTTKQMRSAPCARGTSRCLPENMPGATRFAGRCRPRGSPRSRPARRGWRPARCFPGCWPGWTPWQRRGWRAPPVCWP